ncbi:CcmD family protein [candidate division KSB1 bacterium]|nr:CcmD family protein [candidate division KSB1 bacterium]
MSYLFFAYAVIWMALFVYVVIMAVKLNRVKRDLAVLKEKVGA